jgi:hypothetical protein
MYFPFLPALPLLQDHPAGLINDSFDNYPFLSLLAWLHLRHDHPANIYQSYFILDQEEALPIHQLCIQHLQAIHAMWYVPIKPMGLFVCYDHCRLEMGGAGRQRCNSQAISVFMGEKFFSCQKKPDVIITPAELNKVLK